jgi:TolA-binding protein
MTVIDPHPLPPRLLEGGASQPSEHGTTELLAQAPRAFAPPDDLSLERVWREVGRNRRSGQHRRRQLWQLSLGAGVALTAAGLAALLLRVPAPAPSLAAQLELTAGSVLAAGPSRGWADARAGGSLPAASQLRTQAQGRALLSLSRSTVLLSPDSDLELRSLGAQTVLGLSHGRVLADVEPRREGESFVVQTTRYRVTVKGTIFEVSERSPGDVSVSVSRGLVAVTGSEGSWNVPAGASWQSATPGTLRPDEISPLDRSLLEEVAAAAGPRATLRIEAPEGYEVSEGGIDLGPAPVVWNAPLGRYHFVGTAGAARIEGDTTTTAGAASRLMLAPPAPAPAPVPRAASPEPRAAETSAPAPRSQLAKRAVTRTGLEPRNDPERRVLESAGPAVVSPGPAPRLLARLDLPPRSPAPAVPAPAVAPAPAAASAPDPYLAALALCSAGRYTEGAAALRSIAGGHGPHAELALYHLARLEQHQLGDPVESLSDFLRYQEQYPAGTLVQETELSIVELELQRSSLKDAQSQMDRFLAEHPDGERAPDVHLLRGNLLRQQGDCRAALRDYEKARGSDDIEGEAAFFSGRCEEQLGQPDAAAILFRGYLDRFPTGHRAAQIRAALEGH